MPNEPAPQRPDGFYVGYLPLPSRLKGFLVIVTLILLGGAGVLAFALAGGQQDPGPGTWATAPNATVGTLGLEPYPILWVTNANAPLAAPEGILLVAVGKFGPGGLLDGLQAGDAVTVEGLDIQRGGQRMIEATAITKAQGSSVTVPRLPDTIAPARATAVGIAGEIIDPKCYLGVMKPGQGTIHKACATLCIKGGIPPMILAEDDAGNLIFALLLSQHGQHAPDEIMPLIGDAITARGTPGMLGGLPVFMLETGSLAKAKPAS